MPSELGPQFPNDFRTILSFTDNYIDDEIDQSIQLCNPSNFSISKTFLLVILYQTFIEILKSDSEIHSKLQATKTNPYK